MALVPYYHVVYSDDLESYLLLKQTSHTTLIQQYRTELAAQEVADVLNKWAGQEVS